MADFPYLERLTVKNFKSFQEINIELKRFNVIIGANASGKSNFVQIFKFLKDVREQGLDNAISLQGGIEYLRNFKLEHGQNLVIELKVTLPQAALMRMPFKAEPKLRIMAYMGATWEFELRLGKKSGFKIMRDTWKVDIAAYKREDLKRSPRGEFKSIGPVDTGCFELTTKDGKVQHSIHMSNENSPPSLNLSKYLYSDRIPGKKLLLEYGSTLDYFFPAIPDFFSDMAVYDFDPKLAKRAAPLTGKVELNEDGSNLAIIVKDVISNNADRRKFSNIITDMLPFVQSVNTENIADRSVLFTLTENYFKKRALPSSLISDGTINITALVVALYFQDNALTIVEEPERNIHPSLIARVMEMMNDASSLRQIMITTHNPEIVRYAGLENLFTVRRDSEGHSEIIKSSDQEEIKVFLENEMEVEELYVQNILGS